MPSPTTSRRFTAPLWSSNGFNSDPFRKKLPKEKLEPKVKAPKVHSTHNRPVLHVHADGKRKGIMVVPKEIVETCGADAGVIMGMISTHAPTFQMEKKTIAGMCGLSQRRTKAAIQALCLNNYAHYLPWRAGQRNKGWVLQTNANGNIQRLTGSVLHYSLEDGSAETAERPAHRRNMRRAKAGLSVPKSRREAGNDRAQISDISLSCSEVGGSEESPLASPIMLTPLKKENEPQTPLADAKRGSSIFLGVVVDDLPLPPVDEGNPLGLTLLDQLELALDTPELKAKYPMTPEQEDSIEVYLGQELARQREELAAEAAEIAEGNALVGLPSTDSPAPPARFCKATFALWRRCMHTWEDGDLEKPNEMKAALDLHASAPTLDNLIARAMLAPQLFNRSGIELHDGRVPFHAGYHKFAPHTDELHRGDEAELGLTKLPRHMTQGANALLWMQTHRVGLVFLSSVRNPEALTEVQAAKLVRKLRKGTVTARHIFRLWLLANHGNKFLTVEEACEVLRLKHGMELNSDEAIEGYRLALRRMRQKNLAVMPQNVHGRMDFDIEDESEEDALVTTMAEGKRLIAGFMQAFETYKDVELALRQVGAAGACDAQDHERLANMWAQAHIDQNERVLEQLRSWGAYDRLRAWVSEHSDGRRWIVGVGRQWNFAHLPEIAQTLGWASDAEWWMLNELRKYAMRKAWEAFVDIRGSAHTIWSNSLLERND